MDGGENRRERQGHINRRQEKLQKNKKQIKEKRRRRQKYLSPAPQRDTNVSVKVLVGNDKEDKSQYQIQDNDYNVGLQ